MVGDYVNTINKITRTEEGVKWREFAPVVRVVQPKAKITDKEAAALKASLAHGRLHVGTCPLLTSKEGVLAWFQGAAGCG